MTTLLGGTLLLSEWLAANPPVETHATQGGGVHHGGRGDTTFLDLQSTIAIVTMLITVTIVFEKAKHYLEHNVPPMMSAVLSALFGELTVLGFIALYAFFMLQTGVISAVSILVYGDSEHMLHLFEGIHFLLFFVMVIFLLQAFALVRALMAVEQVWMDSEQAIRVHSKGPVPAIAALLATRRAARFNCCRWCCLRPLWAYRISEAQEEVRYALMRERFVAPPSVKVGEVPLPSDFEFSSYLRRRGATLVTQVLRLSTGTWVTVLVFLIAVLEAPVLLLQVHADHVELVSKGVIVLLGWIVWLACAIVQAKVDRIIQQLQPRHSSLEGGKLDEDEEAPTASLIELPSTPPYEARPPQARHSKHEGLFWGGRTGPMRLIFLVRTLLLVASVTLAVIFSWATGQPGGWKITLADRESALVVALALIPVLDVMLSAPTRLLTGIVVGSSVEQMKATGDVKATLLEMKTEKTLRMLKLLSMLQAQAARARKLQGSGARRSAKPKAVDPAQAAELKVAFEFFDKDKSGFIDKSELKLVLGSLGTALSEDDLALLYVEMDPSGDGKIDLGEFTSVMAQDANKPSPVEVALAIFSVLDHNNSGHVKTSELKATLLGMDAGLMPEDIDETMLLFDKNRSGDITKHEFVQTLELLNTFA